MLDNNLRDLRRQLAVSQRGLGQIFGVTGAFIALAEMGRRPLSRRLQLAFEAFQRAAARPDPGPDARGEGT